MFIPSLHCHVEIFLKFLCLSRTLLTHFFFLSLSLAYSVMLHAVEKGHVIGHFNVYGTVRGSQPEMLVIINLDLL